MTVLSTAPRTTDPKRVHRIPGYVWCDVHGEIHADNPDPYDMHEDCSSEHRAVYGYFRPSEGFRP